MDYLWVLRGAFTRCKGSVSAVTVRGNGPSLVACAAALVRAVLALAAIAGERMPRQLLGLEYDVQGEGVEP